MPRGMLDEVMQQIVPVKTPWTFSFADTFADSDAMEQWQESQQGRLKRSDIYSIGKLNVSLYVVFP